MIRYLILLLCTVLVFGCTNVDSVLFATKTSLSVVEVDSKPASLTVAYDRVEGYVAPRYSNGALPPVLASIESDGKIFGAGVRQVFATGAAAHSLALSQPEDSADNQESQQLLWGPTMPKKLAFFGTSTSTGLKVGFSGNIPDSFVFGYKRKEFSLIPLGTTVNGELYEDFYPSVIASIDTSASAGEGTDGKEATLKNNQFFATGSAAINLAYPVITHTHYM